MKINFINMLFFVLTFTVSKCAVLCFSVKKFTVLRTRIIMCCYAALFSPLLTTGWILFDQEIVCSFAVLPISFLGIVFDLGIMQWVRAIFEPSDTTKDLDYPDKFDLTNL